MSTITALQLSNLTVFQNMSPKEIEVLALALRERKLAASQELYRQGERGATCHIILQGALSIQLDAGNGTPREVGLALPGDLLGEVALLDGGPRSATVCAGSEGATVGELSKADFDQVFGAGSPFAFKLMDLVAGRMVGRMREAMGRLVTAVTAEDEGRSGGAGSGSGADEAKSP